MALTERLAGWGVLFLPGALVVYLSFNAGGYFPGTPALVAVILLLCLAARIVVAERPFEGFSPALAVCIGALGLYAAWTLISSSWSDSTWRAMVEFDRALLYLAAVVLFGSFARQPERIRWMARGVALGIVIVCTAGVITRVLPHLWPISANLGENRLSYPLTYWNAEGILASIGAILCFHFTASRSEHPVVRIAAAGAVPLLATTVYFTLSRGAIAAAVIGLLAYVVLGRPRGLLSGVIAVGPTTLAALLAAHHADLLTGLYPTSKAAANQGHHVAAVLAASVAGALVLRAALLSLDSWAGRRRFPWQEWRPFVPSVAAVAIVAALVAGVALDAPGYVSHQYHRFVNGNRVAGAGSARLTDPGNNGRIDIWRVAIDDGFDPAKLDGQGAGTFEALWATNRPRKDPQSVRDTHSLYVQALGELGIVGLLLVLTFVVAILYGFAARLRGPSRTIYAALFAAGIAWALHAGLDWDWQMPAITLWLFALGGAALAAPKRKLRFHLSPPPVLRAGIAVAILLLALIPARVAISQGKMNQAVVTFDRHGKCSQVISEADDAISVLGVRPDAYQLKGYCQARLGRFGQAIASMRKAVDRDPKFWEYRYGLAVVEGAAGRDPRPAALAALGLDPLEPSNQDLYRRLGGGNRAVWRVQGRFLLQSPLF